MSLYTKQEALDYHALGRQGKTEVFPVKPCRTQKDLSLAYSPGVADPCLAIRDNVDDVFKYTGRGNLVAVVSNGTAVLGLGNIGPEAGKPVMEGKGVLFKVFADIDVFDIEIAELDPEKLCAIIKAIEPTFGGINLEDIKSPECFEIEDTLSREMNIPVFHDDQHGTAIISAAGLLNALEIAEKRIEDCRFVISGAGAAAIATGRLYKFLGADPEKIAMFDAKGHVHRGRKNLNPQKNEFAGNEAYPSLAEAMRDADVFLGLSVKDVLTPDMVKSMSAQTPVIFACANPDPEIAYPDAKRVRPDAIMATGRSDYPNQINNVLCFPFLFRGALDVHARAITENMKAAAVRAIASLAKEPIPGYILEAYDLKELSFGIEYVIPKALDLRLIEVVSAAVAEAAMKDGVARVSIADFNVYRSQLRDRLVVSRRRTESVLQSYGL